MPKKSDSLLKLFTESLMRFKIILTPDFIRWFRNIPLIVTLKKYISGRLSNFLFVIFWHLTGGRTIYRNGRLVLYAPAWFYDLCVLLFWPTNTLISWLSWKVRPFPRSVLHDWNLDPSLAPCHVSLSTNKLNELKIRIVDKPRSGFKEKELISVFDSLPSPTQEQMFGHFKGRIVRSKSWLDWCDYPLMFANMLGINWGKRYRSPYVGDPLVCNLWDRFFFPIPVWGNVSIPVVGYREGSGVAMTYDCQPWHDHFRILKTNQDGSPMTVLGFWATREKICGWFTLTQMPHINAAVDHMHRLNAPNTYKFVV